MAIYSLHHSWVGRSTHAPGTAGAHIHYITRPDAVTRSMAERMPENRHAAQAWLDQQEDADRKNARVIDKVMVALPIELTPEQRAELVHDFAEKMTKGRASWFAAIHDGPADADNPHAHIAFRDRDFETGKRVMQLSEMRSRKGELGGTDKLRLVWEQEANQALERAGLDVRIDRRSLEDQGIKREAEIHVGPTKERQDRPESKPLEVTRHLYGEHKAVEIDYPAIDEGRTRAEFNDEIRARNLEQERQSGGDRRSGDDEGGSGGGGKQIGPAMPERPGEEEHEHDHAGSEVVGIFAHTVLSHLLTDQVIDHVVTHVAENLGHVAGEVAFEIGEVAKHAAELHEGVEIIKAATGKGGKGGGHHVPDLNGGGQAGQPEFSPQKAQATEQEQRRKTAADFLDPAQRRGWVDESIVERGTAREREVDRERSRER